MSSKNYYNKQPGDRSIIGTIIWAIVLLGVDIGICFGTYKAIVSCFSLVGKIFAGIGLGIILFVYNFCLIPAVLFQKDNSRINKNQSTEEKDKLRKEQLKQYIKDHPDDFPYADEIDENEDKK